MDDAEKLAALRAEADTNEADSALLPFLLDAKEMILNRMYPYLDEKTFEQLNVPGKYERKQIRIAAWLINKRGAEGETQHIENGIHRQYKNGDAPEELLREVIPMVGIPR